MGTSKIIIIVVLLFFGIYFPRLTSSSFSSNAFAGFDATPLSFLVELDAVANGNIKSNLELLSATFGVAGAQALIQFKANIALEEFFNQAVSEYSTLKNQLDNIDDAMNNVIGAILNAQSLGPCKMGNTAAAIYNATATFGNVQATLDEIQATLSPNDRNTANFLASVEGELQNIESILAILVKGVYNLLAANVEANVTGPACYAVPPRTLLNIGQIKQCVTSAWKVYTSCGEVYQDAREVRFRFYPDAGQPSRSVELKVGDFNGLKASGYNQNYPLVLIIPGLVSTTNVADILRSAYLDPNTPNNVIVVQWENVAGKVMMPSTMTGTFVDYVGAYVQMAYNVDFTATVVSTFLQFLNQQPQNNNIHPSGSAVAFLDAHFVCHSLGAHVGGLAANYYETATGRIINRITAADPAGPLFQVDPSGPASVAQPFNKNQARFTQALVTNIGGFGFTTITNVAAVDVRINSGIHQPYCTVGTGDNTRNLDFNGPCSHNMAAIYLAWSTNTTFTTDGCVSGTPACNPTQVTVGEQIGLSTSFSGMYTADITIPTS